MKATELRDLSAEELAAKASDLRGELFNVRVKRATGQLENTALAKQLHEVVATDQPYTFLYAPRKNEILDPKIVMVADDGCFEPLRADRRGELYHFFRRWRKLSHTPQF